MNVDRQATALVGELLEHIRAFGSQGGEATLEYDRQRLVSLTSAAMNRLLEGLGDATLDDWKKLQADLEEARWEVVRLRSIVEGFTDMTVDVGLDTLVEVTKAKAAIDDVPPAALRDMFAVAMVAVGMPVTKTARPESTRERQARLRPVLDGMRQHGQSVFLDLCELVVMLAEGIDGAIKADFPRVVVHIRQRAAAARIAKKRAAEERAEER